MKPRQIAVSALLVLGTLAGAASAQGALAAEVHIGPSGRASVDVGYFHTGLARYGRWVDRSAYGEVFVPSSVPSGWRPYSRGHWVYSDYGWTWVSDASEPYGWATYHYGRWSYDSDYGWVWVPGTEWGPAWVDWQEGDSYVGWAPLPPTVGYSATYGIDTGAFAIGVDLAPSAFVFVPERSFLAADVSRYCVRPEENVRFFSRTRNITDYAVVDHRIVNRGWPVATAERVTGRRVTRYQVADLRSADPRARFAGNRVSFFRPQVTAAANARTAERIAAASRRADSAVHQQVRRGVEAQTAALEARRSAAVGRQAAVHEKRQIAARAQTARTRSTQRVRTQAERRQIAARGQAARTRERARANAERHPPRVQAARTPQHPRVQPERTPQRARVQPEPTPQRARVQSERTPQRQRVQTSRQTSHPRQQAARHQAQARPHPQPARAPQPHRERQQAVHPQAGRQQAAAHPRGKPEPHQGQPDPRRGQDGR